jgi:transposase
VIDEATARLARIESALVEQTEAWRLAPVVVALQALKGIDRIAATILVTELGLLAQLKRRRRSLPSLERCQPILKLLTPL